MNDEPIDDQLDERSEEERRHDERLDAVVRGLAMDYHRPPATPREAMWEAIAAGRGATGAAGGASPSSAPRSDDPRVLPMRRGRSAAPRHTVYAVAATLLLVAGIGIGTRLARRELPAPNSGLARGTPVTAPSAPVARRDSTLGVAGGATDPARSDTPDPGTAAERDLQLTSIEREAARSGRSSGNGSRADVEATSYGLATLGHLAQVEALLTSFRSDAPVGAASGSQARTDAQLATWARDLLINTRLLLDSPAAKDPLRRQLLEDLELVLVQIVQLSPGTAVDDRLLIERSLSRDHVMTRLRSAIPAGQTSGT